MGYSYKLLDEGNVNDRLAQVKNEIILRCPFASVVSDSATSVIISFQAGHHMRFFVSGAYIAACIRTLDNAADFEASSFGPLTLGQNQRLSLCYSDKAISIGCNTDDHGIYVVKSVGEGYLLNVRSNYYGYCYMINKNSDAAAARIVAFSNPSQKMHNNTDQLITPAYYTDLVTGKLRAFDGCVYSTYLPTTSTGIHVASDGQIFGATASSGTNKIIVKG